MKPKTRTFSVPCGQTPSSFHITSVAEVAGGHAVKLTDLTSTSLASTNCSSSPCPLLSTVSKGAETLSQFLISLFRSTRSQQPAGLSLSSTPWRKMRKTLAQRTVVATSFPARCMLRQFVCFGLVKLSFPFVESLSFLLFPPYPAPLVSSLAWPDPARQPLASLLRYRPAVSCGTFHKLAMPFA